jgi:hypothetical protein
LPLSSVHRETMLADVILRSTAKRGTMKNLIESADAEILRPAPGGTQNDTEEFPDEDYLKIIPFCWQKIR